MAENGGEPIRVATVKRGDQWYVSLFYTIADNAVHQAGLPNPTAQSSPPDGQDSPEDAVNALHRAGAAQGDLEGVIALLPPDEMGVLHDYGQLLDRPGRRRGPVDQRDGPRRRVRQRHLGRERRHRRQEGVDQVARP